MVFKKTASIHSFVAGDATNIQEVLHPKNGDPEELPYSLALASLTPGTSSISHCLSERSETYIIIKGKGTAFIDSKPQAIEMGDVVYIPVGAQQYVRNDGDETLQFYCIVAPPWTAESEHVDE